MREGLHDLLVPQHVGVRRHKGERAELPVHQKLPPELLAQHILGRLIVDGAHDVADDPDGISVFQVRLHHAVARRVVVLHAGRVHQYGASAQHDPLARVEARLLDDRPVRAALQLVRRVHVPMPKGARRRQVNLAEVPCEP